MLLPVRHQRRAGDFNQKGRRVWYEKGLLTEYEFSPFGLLPVARTLGLYILLYIVLA
jgi:hypothetical protein